eukprot:TRINITY_DN8406_c0_g1_i1.p3 TRINITY_DN8406_c0_g1~~TRINITY_DN8406_c0_g1_i1.p3  ORF type:complete len:140 (-),score=17.37 TRINITY_DN8406_c0_g1_i1:66-485(-)
MLSMTTMFSIAILISWDSYLETSQYLLYGFLFAFGVDYLLDITIAVICSLKKFALKQTKIWKLLSYGGFAMVLSLDQLVVKQKVKRKVKIKNKLKLEEVQDEKLMLQPNKSKFLTKQVERKDFLSPLQEKNCYRKFQLQ